MKLIITIETDVNQRDKNEMVKELYREITNVLTGNNTSISIIEEVQNNEDNK